MFDTDGCFLVAPTSSGDLVTASKSTSPAGEPGDPSGGYRQACIVSVVRFLRR
jgi:hypothetical protein